MKVAVVGTGISGLVVADGLARAGHELAVYEAGTWVGGHTNTVDVDDGGRPLAIDTGFIVFNERSRPASRASAGSRPRGPPRPTR